MKELLESKDLLKEPRVVAAYWGLMDWGHEFRKAHWWPILPINTPNDRCEKCHRCRFEVQGSACKGFTPISSCCIEKVAFEMRDACVTCNIIGMESKWLDAIYDITGDDSCIDTLAKATAKQWIAASTLAWENSK